jgi:hypothetical protein
LTVPVSGCASTSNGVCDMSCNFASTSWDHGDCCSATTYGTCRDPSSPYVAWTDLDGIKTIVASSGSDKLNLFVVSVSTPRSHARADVQFSSLRCRTRSVSPRSLGTRVRLALQMGCVSTTFPLGVRSLAPATKATRQHTRSATLLDCATLTQVSQRSQDQRSLQSATILASNRRPLTSTVRSASSASRLECRRYVR